MPSYVAASTYKSYWPSKAIGAVSGASATLLTYYRAKSQQQSSLLSVCTSAGAGIVGTSVVGMLAHGVERYCRGPTPPLPPRERAQRLSVRAGYAVGVSWMVGVAPLLVNVAGSWVWVGARPVSQALANNPAPPLVQDYTQDQASNALVITVAAAGPAFAGVCFGVGFASGYYAAKYAQQWYTPDEVAAPAIDAHAQPELDWVEMSG